MSRKKYPIKEAIRLAYEDGLITREDMLRRRRMSTEVLTPIIAKLNLLISSKHKIVRFIVNAKSKKVMRRYFKEFCRSLDEVHGTAEDANKMELEIGGHNADTDFEEFTEMKRIVTKLMVKLKEIMTLFIKGTIQTVSYYFGELGMPDYQIKDSNQFVTDTLNEASTAIRKHLDQVLDVAVFEVSFKNKPNEASERFEISKIDLDQDDAKDLIYPLKKEKDEDSQSNSLDATNQLSKKIPDHADQSANLKSCNHSENQNGDEEDLPVQQEVCLIDECNDSVNRNGDQEDLLAQQEVCLIDECNDSVNRNEDQEEVCLIDEEDQEKLHSAKDFSLEKEEENIIMAETSLYNDSKPTDSPAFEKTLISMEEDYKVSEASNSSSDAEVPEDSEIDSSCLVNDKDLKKTKSNGKRKSSKSKRSFRCKIFDSEFHFAIGSTDCNVTSELKEVMKFSLRERYKKYNYICSIRYNTFRISKNGKLTAYAYCTEKSCTKFKFIGHVDGIIRVYRSGEICHRKENKDPDDSKIKFDETPVEPEYVFVKNVFKK